ncbi:MAG: head decoration protein [Pseudomonadota bacterium]
MPTVNNEPNRLGDWLKYELNPSFTRDEITVISTETPATGTVMGQVTASKEYGEHNPGASDGLETAKGILIDHNVGAAAKGTLSTGSGNSGLDWSAKKAGIHGNDISIAFVDPGANSQTLTITVTDKAISISLGTTAGGAINTTASALITAIGADANASALVSVALSSGSSGASNLAALAATSMTGGLGNATDNQGVLLVRGPARIAKSKLVWKTGTTEAQKTTALTALAALDIVVADEA